MKVNLNIEIEDPRELVVLGQFFSTFGTVAPAEPIRQPAPEPQKRVAKPAETPVEKKPEPTPAPKRDPEPQPDSEQDDGVEEVTKDVVAKELRAFIAKAGKDGPREALAVLKQFGAGKFDELAPDSYSKFLSALKRA